MTPSLPYSFTATLLFGLGVTSATLAGGDPSTATALDDLRRQNERLQEQLKQQQGQIEQLTRTVADIKANSQSSGDELVPRQTDRLPAFKIGKVVLSGEGGVAMFRTGSRGAFPNSEFRIDEARLFLDAQVWDDAYFFAEINLTTREAADEYFELGELYLDFEGLGHNWGWDKALNVRAGRMYIPFGEEYQHRNAIDNSLISHSLTDLWGYDEGVEIYGDIRGLRYAAAVQNGGDDALHDHNVDKSVAIRFSYSPVSWLDTSVSAMRTGDLEVKGDGLSAIWFGNGFFKSLSSANTTRFHANLLEADAKSRLGSGYLRAAGGAITYGDNDPVGNTGRDLYYYYLEAMHPLPASFYAAARFSQVFSNDGFPVVGNEPAGSYFRPILGADLLAKEMFRLSLGVGYRISSKLVIKTEYSFDRGRQLNGASRNHEDLFGIEAAAGF